MVSSRSSCSFMGRKFLSPLVHVTGKSNPYHKENLSGMMSDSKQDNVFAMGSMIDVLLFVLQVVARLFRLLSRSVHQSELPPQCYSRLDLEDCTDESPLSRSNLLPKPCPVSSSEDILFWHVGKRVLSITTPRGLAM